MATARDIARIAGVSTSTVSHVLNGTRPVSAELRDRVIAAAEGLHYEPDALARSLRIRRSNSIGLVISDIGNPFFTSVVRGVEDVAQARGYSVILCNSDEDPEKESAYLRLLIGRRVDGLILAPSGVRHEYLDRLTRHHFPLVFLDREVAGLSIPTVLLDNRRAAREGVEHLIRLGHRRIAMVAGRPAITSTTERIAGYRAALVGAGIEVDEHLIVSGGSRTAEARRAVEVLLGLDRPPTAILVGNNLMTIGAIAGIHSAGLTVPDDVSIVGIDDFPWADVFHPRLTTIAQPTYQLGRTAADLVLRRVSGESNAERAKVVLPGRLVVRDSAGPVRAADDHEPLQAASG